MARCTAPGGAEFQGAVDATGRTQLILADPWTGICVFPKSIANCSGTEAGPGADRLPGVKREYFAKMRVLKT